MKQVLFRNWLCNVHLGKYHNGRSALRLTDAVNNAPIATCTINEPLHQYPTKDNWVLIKNYSENKGIYKALLDAGVIEPMMDINQDESHHVILCEIPTDVYNKLEENKTFNG